VPSWTRTTIPSADRIVNDAAPTVEVKSDPATWEEFGYADECRAIVDVEYIESGVTLYVYRWAGPTADQMVLLDPTTPALTINAAQVSQVKFPTPLPPYGMVHAVLSRTAAGTYTGTFRVLQCFLTD